MPVISYAGTELEVFGEARNWKRYLRDLISPHLRGDVLEIGAGIGTTSRALRTEAQTSWTALEPDDGLAQRLRENLAGFDPPIRCAAGTLAAIEPRPLFDCVIYIDVLEHIDHDRDELMAAAVRLKPMGTLVVLSPAYQGLYTPFDAAIGHRRRYDRTEIQTLTPPRTALIQLRYVDAVGLLLVIGNRLLLHSAMPTIAQVRFWDRVCIPLARLVDPMVGGRVGKSVLAVWRKE